MLTTLHILLRMVKIEHSVFALPFAYSGAFLAAGGWPGWACLLPLTVAMVAVRSWAMGFNRLVDLPFDRENPRTQTRPLVTGEITPRATKIFLAVCGLVFVAACALLNPLCLALSLPALLISAVYSYTKRFTWLCHFYLGLVLGLAPLAGWISFAPSFGLPALLLFWGVLFWVAGFDILYALQDRELDRELGLYSLPASLGIETSLALSWFCHVNTSLLFLLAGMAASLSWPYYVVWAGVSALLIWEHTLIKADDLSKITMAFFTLNGVVAVAYFGGVLLGILT